MKSKNPIVKIYEKNKGEINKQLDAILTKMCELVNVDYSSIDITTKDWFMEHSWSKETESEFKKWLVGYLKENDKARDYLMFHNTVNEDSLRRCAEAFVFSYGWKYEEEKIVLN